MGYMDDFIRNKKVRKDPETKHVVVRDKWDRGMVADLERELKQYKYAQKDLTEITHTGYEAMADAALSLFKASPHLKHPNDIRPSYMVDHVVMDELLDMKEFENLHMTSTGDPISAGLASVAMEPELEKLFNRLEEERKASEQIEQMLQQAGGLSDDVDDLMDQMESAAANGDEEGAKNFQEQAAKAQEQLDQLKQQIEGESQDLQDRLENKTGQIRAGLAKAMDQATEQQEALDAAESWGLDPGGVTRMNADARLELAEKLGSEKFKLMAEYFGRLQNLAVTSQMSKTDQSFEEVYDIEMGDNLNRIIPSEILYLGDDTLIYDFLRRYTERGLSQYALRGQEEVNKGSIILLEDGSSSMGGDRAVASKAIGLGLLKIASMQKRGFKAIHFAGSNMHVDFTFKTDETPVAMQRFQSRNHEYDRTGIEAVMDFAETSLNGGTDFHTPLARALEFLQQEYDENGSTESDIVFLTDGICGVSEEFLAEFKEKQEELDFRVFGIAIGTDPKTEPFWTICDERAITFSDLKDVSRVEEIFKSI